MNKPVLLTDEDFKNSGDVMEIWFPYESDSKYNETFNRLKQQILNSQKDGFANCLHKVIKDEINVRKKIKDWNLTGYEKVSQDTHIQLLEEVLLRADIMFKQSRGKN